MIWSYSWIVIKAIQVISWNPCKGQTMQFALGCVLLMRVTWKHRKTQYKSPHSDHMGGFCNYHHSIWCSMTVLGSLYHLIAATTFYSLFPQAIAASQKSISALLQPMYPSLPEFTPYCLPEYTQLLSQSMVGFLKAPYRSWSI
jgi:hypothetical protein